MSVHVFYGHAKREPDPEDECIYCTAHEEVMAYTYFGGPVCGFCWDGRWRQEEDGKCDPPFAEITRKVSGEWLTANVSNQERTPE